MTKNINQLEKIIKEQAAQIISLKKAMNGLQRQLQLVARKAESVYHTSKRNTMDIDDINKTLRRFD